MVHGGAPTTLNLMAMMASSRYSVATALFLTFLASQSSSFAPVARHVFYTKSASFEPSRIIRHVSAAEELEAESIMNMEFLTPEGTGLSSPISRIVKLSKRDNGYYRANGSDPIVDVMDGITRDIKHDVALVYDGNELLGIFTESDYIKVRCSSRRNGPRSRAMNKSRPVSLFSLSKIM